MMLRAVTFVFTLGYIPSPVFMNLLPHEGVYPSIEDDFGVVLLKLGTACFESTQFSGLRNELVPVTERGPWIQMTQTSSHVRRSIGTAGGFATEITDIDVPELTAPHLDIRRGEIWKGFWKAVGRAILSTLWRLILAAPGGKQITKMAIQLYYRRWWYGPRQWRFWQRQAWAEPVHFRQQRVRDSIRRIEAALQRQVDREKTSSAISTQLQLRPEVTPEPDSTSEVDAYAVFLDQMRSGGEIDSDEEDWEDDETEVGDRVDEDNESVAESEDNHLYRDLAEGGETLQPVLLAHLTTHSGSPLTRRRYREMTSGQPASSDLVDIMSERQLLLRPDRQEWDEERRRCCVICTIEPRDTILWPCRCLAVCNECRESLASRLAARDHMCPCCRRKWVMRFFPFEASTDEQGGRVQPYLHSMSSVW